MQFYLAHVCALGGTAAIVYNAVAKLYSDEELRPWFKTRVEIPVAVGVAGMFAVFANTRASKVDHSADFLQMKMTGPYLSVYWVLYCLLVLYVLYHGIRAFNDLRDDQPDKHGRRLIDIYLIASGWAVIAMVLRILTAAIWQLQIPVLMNIMFFATCCTVSMFTWGAGYAWIQRVSWFSKRPGWAGRAMPHLRRRRNGDRAGDGERADH